MSFKVHSTSITVLLLHERQEGPIMLWASVFTWLVLRNTIAELLELGDLWPLAPQDLSLWDVGHSCVEEE